MPGPAPAGAPRVLRIDIRTRRAAPQGNLAVPAPGVGPAAAPPVPALDRAAAPRDEGAMRFDAARPMGMPAGALPASAAGRGAA